MFGIIYDVIKSIIADNININVARMTATTTMSTKNMSNLIVPLPPLEDFVRDVGYNAG